MVSFIGIRPHRPVEYTAHGPSREGVAKADSAKVDTCRSCYLSHSCFRFDNNEPTTESRRISMLTPLQTCVLCGREVSQLTIHHLIPRTRHKNRKNKRTFSRKEVRGRLILVCAPCHKNIHAVLSNKELERDYNTIDALRCHPKIKNFTQWITDKPPHMHVVVHKNTKK